MAREYYYLIAGLPDLILDQEQKDFNLIALKNEIKENIHPNDYRFVELLFSEYDNDNFLNYLFERNKEFSPLGKYLRMKGRRRKIFFIPIRLRSR